MTLAGGSFTKDEALPANTIGCFFQSWSDQHRLSQEPSSVAGVKLKLFSKALSRVAIVALLTISFAAGFLSGMQGWLTKRAPCHSYRQAALPVIIGER